MEQDEVNRSPRLLTRRDQRLEWSFPKSDQVGYVRGMYNGLAGTTCEAHMIFLGIGQKSPLHSYSGEHIIFQLEGELEFVIDGSRFGLEQYDMLFIPADITYEYANVGPTSVLFLSIVGKFEEWPPKGIYYD